MKRNGSFHTIALSFLITFSACSNTKFLTDHQALYIGSKVEVDDSTMRNKAKKELAGTLNDLTRPKPNSNILGLRLKLFAYNIAGNPKKENSLRGWLKYKIGEPPVLLSDVDLDYNETVLRNFLENTGYFRAASSGDTVVKRKRAKVTYTVKPGPQYIIANVNFQQDSTSVLLNKINETAGKTFLKPGDAYNLNLIKGERDRIDAYLKENGFYYFNPEYLLIQVDSTIGNQQVNLYVNVKPSTPQVARKVYTINDIYVYSNYSLSTAVEDTNKNDAVFYKGYYVVDNEKIFKPKLFQQSILFNPGDVYSRKLHNLTINRLINLNLFKFVKNRFEPVENSDSAKLDDFYYLTRYPKKSIRAEAGANTKSNNLTGSQITFGFQNRNTFKGGELLAVNVQGGFETQFSGQFRGYNTYRMGADAALSIPRFLIPFFNFNTRGGFVPNTNIKIGFDILNRIKLYTINSFHLSYGYIWKESIRKQHEFNPVSINYVQPINVTDEYKTRSLQDVTLRNVIDTQFILGSNYSYLFNELIGDDPYKSGIYFNGMLDLSGNIAGLFNKGNTLQGKPSRIAGAIFSQYIKSEVDFRLYVNTGKTSVLANRVILGFGYPYGNSVSLPFIKQFFIGGNNSLRAFRSRSVGPGTYLPPNYGADNFLPDQSGDIKLEMNSELRSRLFSIVNGAVFVDAGNIWLYQDNPFMPKPGGKFSKDFLKELAVGAGVGLRIDITFLVLRLDVAFPLRKPYLPVSDRWVFDKINFGNSDWRKENLIFNLAIGYPF